MKYSKHAPKWLVDSHKAMMRQIEEPVVNQKLLDKIMAPAKRAILEQLDDNPERQELLDWTGRPTPTDVFYGDALDDVAILDELVKKENDVWMRPIWKRLRKKEGDFDDVGRRLYADCVTAHKAIGGGKEPGSDKDVMRRIVEEQASRLAPAGDVYLAGGGPLNELEYCLIPKPNRLILGSIKRDASKGPKSWTPANSYALVRINCLVGARKPVGKLTIISSNVPEMQRLIGSRVDGGIVKYQAESREKAEEAAGKKAAKKEKEWVAKYKEVKREHPEWKVGVIWDEVASRLEDTPYKGSAPYMQSKIKIPPD